MSDLLGVLLTLLLLATNAFFVAAEFALISARRDRLEALAEQGKRSAVAVIQAGQNLSLMLAGAQLGITVCSILLGRVGEPAVAHLLETPFDLLGVSDAVLHTVSFLVALTVVVVLHVLLGEMVPKNIAIAGPESAAMLLVPPYLIWIRIARPFIGFYDWCAKLTLRAFGVEAKNELENTVSMIELSEMIAESLSEGLLDPEEHNRLSRALKIRTRSSPTSPCPSTRSTRYLPPPTAAGLAWLRSNRPSPRPATRAFPWSTRPVGIPATCTSRTCCRWWTIPTRSSTPPWCDRCRTCSRRCPCPRPYRDCAATTATSLWSPPTTA